MGISNSAPLIGNQGELGLVQPAVAFCHAALLRTFLLGLSLISSATDSRLSRRERQQGCRSPGWNLQTQFFQLRRESGAPFFIAGGIEV